MPEGGAQIVVMMVMMAVLVMVMTMIVIMIVAGAQHPGAEQIDQQSHRGDGGRLGVVDGHGLDEPRRRLIADHQRDQGQHDGAGEAREVAQLAGAEGKARVAGVAAREAVGEGSDRQRPGMGRHVPAVGQKRHRAEERAAGDLGHHHGGGQADHQPGAPFIALVRAAQEDVLVLPIVERVAVHAGSYFWK